MAHGKRFREAKKVVTQAAYPLEEAIRILKKMPQPKFDQTVELHLRLGVDPKQSDQAMRGAISLPAGLGKKRRVVAFCSPDQVEAAKTAGAVEAGAEDLIEKIQGGWLDFDVAVAQPPLMSKVARLGRVLGPVGKMPTPKAGTVGPDIATLVTEYAAGKLEFRTDAGGNIHAAVGKVSFDEPSLVKNVQAFVDHIRRHRPTAAKGQFFLKAVLAATMSPGIPLDLKSLPTGL